MSPLFDIALQCCDAGSYIGNGSECAVDGKCYGELRPIGDYLWFAVPQKLGWPLESLIAANIAMMLASVLLSVVAFRKLLQSTSGLTYCKYTCVLMAIFSFAIHAVFLRPTLFNTLSDPPANLFLLNSFWLLMIAHFNPRQGAAAKVQFLLSGLSLGLAAWMRTFYLYPVFVGIGMYLLFWIFFKKRKPGQLLLLLALLPISTQYITMHKAYGSLGYLQEETTNGWVNVHLNQPFVGYDTIFPREGYFWEPQHCKATLGILNGWNAKDYKGMACIVMERAYFYLGTYEPQTYKFTDRTNQLIYQYAESIGATQTDWFESELTSEPDVAMAPDGKKTADKLTVTTTKPDGNGDVVMWVPLRASTPHTFSVWLWSPVARTVNLAIKRHNDDAIVALQRFELTTRPTRYSITGTTLDFDRNPTTGSTFEAGLYDVDIGRTPYRDAPVSFGTEQGDFLYAWGAQLETGSAMTDYDPSGTVGPDSVRKWRPELLALNAIMLLLALMAIIRQRTFWLQQGAGVCILSIVFASAAESIAIIPEQRFGIGWMVFFWLLAASFVFSGFKMHFKNTVLLRIVNTH
jgi:hypothetical protein